MDLASGLSDSSNTSGDHGHLRTAAPSSIVFIVIGAVGAVMLLAVVWRSIWRRYRRYHNYDPRPVIQFTSVTNISLDTVMDNRDKWWERHNSPGFSFDIKHGIRKMWIPTLKTIQEDANANGDEISAQVNSSRTTSPRSLSQVSLDTGFLESYSSRSSRGASKRKSEA